MENLKDYIKCFDCEKIINIGDDYYVEERRDGVEVPYCPDCSGRTLDINDPFIETFWQGHANWADN